MSKLVDFDLSNTYVTGVSFEKARDKIAELFDFVGKSKFAPNEIQLYPSDYKAICGQLQRSLNKKAREAARAERIATRSKKNPVIAPDKVGSVTYRGIPVTQGYKQTRPRRFEP